MLIRIYEMLLLHHDTLCATSLSVAALSQSIAQTNPALWNLYQSKTEELRRDSAERDSRVRSQIVEVIQALTKHL